MKKIIAVTAVAVLVMGSVFAMDMSIGLNGLAGADNSGVDGVAVGGGLDITIDLYKGLGFRIGSSIITSKLAGGDGLSVTSDLNVIVPALVWYNYNSGLFGFGGGLGLGCSIGNGVKLTLTGGLETRYNISGVFSIFLGVNGNLDVLPTLTKAENGNTSTYKFVKSDFSRNSIYAVLGARYRIDLNK